jgi:glycine/D-amino acid oxidase-like deaminating enzyme
VDAVSGPRRREFLRGAAAVLLGAALPSCSGRRASIGGRLHGSSAARGHLLRGGEPLPPPSSREKVPVAIVGAGVAGLSAAWKLARSGLGEFVVLDLEDGSGGTSASGENAVSRFPWGAHYVPVPTRDQRALGELLAGAGVIRGFDGAGRAIPLEEHLCRAPQERLFLDGTWHEGLLERDGGSPEEARQLDLFQRETQALAARRGADGRRAFAIPVALSSRDPDLLALDRISMAEWMAARGLDAPRLRWYVEYACRDDFGLLLEGTSAWAGLHYFCSRVAVPGEEGAEFLTWPEGNGFLVRHLSRGLEDRVRTGALVIAVDPGTASGPATVRWHDVAAGATREIEAERVVCALPRFAARRVVAGLDPGEAGFRTSPWVVANLTLRRRPAETGFPICWDNVIHGSPSLGYVVATHQRDRTATSSVWTWYRPFCGPDPAADRGRLLALPWEGIRDMALDDLLPAHPDLEECVEAVDARVWGHAMVRPEPGFLWGGPREGAAAPRGRVHFAAADLGGLPLFEEAQWAGVRAAEEILAILGKPFESSL